MQAFGQFLWPPQGHTSQAQYGTESDAEDANHVEQLVYPADSQMSTSAPNSPGHAVVPLFNQLPTITLNNVPVPPEPMMPGTYAHTSLDHSRQRTRSRSPRRTPSPRGSKRNSPQPSPERDTSRGEDGGKIRLVNVPDPQQETLMESLRQLVVRNNQLLESVQKDLLEIKRDTREAKELANKAEERAINAEKALEDERVRAEQRLQQMQTDIRAEASNQIQEAERRTQITLKALKDMGQSRQARSNVSTNAMAVDGPQEQLQPQNADTGENGKNRIIENSRPTEPIPTPMPQISAPPRFPEPPPPQSSSIPHPSSLSKPLIFKRPKSIGNPKAIPPLKNAFLHAGESDEDDMDSSSASEEGEEFRQRKSRKNVSDLNGEEMLKLLLKTMGLDATNIGSMNKSGRRRAHRDFKEPAKRVPKPRGKQDLMAKIYSSNTPLQRQMELWEKKKEGEGPKVKPMKVNWSNFDGLEGGNPSDEIKEFVAGYFWDRLARLRTIIKKSRPKVDETIEQTSARTEGQHLQALSVARRNSRRNQKHQDRVDICLENLPEVPESIVTDEQRDWKRKYDLVVALGPEGTSSDETDQSDPDVYLVRTLPWRSKTATQALISVDDAKNTTNGYGNIRPGNRPRNRQRRRNALNSARKAPIGKPKNLYDRDWYGELNAGKKRALKVKPDVDYE